ncbi:transcriptional regulator, GntR family [Virgibacillus subterraneus]|uniref:Transcriptional regulator, GntR family n=1 Tax=Virgibacillus subterraneus TaxID=621109 RepID=A0A1H9CAB6_9BACI|nr:GntR family transcriptional regulator [Virgibacillus subterraneus]SEP97723.1 transcriptional regulator, GntR family [Virgibacillus subterraneus]
MGIDFDGNKPIYQQLINRISSEIIRGHRAVGGKLPSVREYALEAGVNANTVQRVYRELENMEIVETKRGQGTFVTCNLNRLSDLREGMKLEFIQQFIRDMNDMGYSTEEMIEGIKSEGRGSK